MNARALSVAALAIAFGMVLTSCGPSQKGPAETPASTNVNGHPVDPATAGTITGSVKLDGAPPAMRVINMGAAAKCGEQHSTPLMSEEVVPGANGTLQNVVVYLKGDFAQYSFPPMTTPATMDQTGCAFVPHVVAVMTGQPLDIKNSDAMTHNVNGASSNNPRSNKSEPAGGPVMEETFSHEEVAIPLKCNIHAWMKAYVAVIANPYFQVTGKDGSFELKNVPPGDYTLVAWQEKYGTTEQKVTVAPKGENSVTLTFKPTAGAS
jgi:plastocyanin